MPGAKSGVTAGQAASAGVGLPMPVLWAGLCALWNAYGALQLSTGGKALGPTATFAGAGLAVLLAVALIVSARRWSWLYRGLALVAAGLAAVTVWNSFVLERSLWPSELWRWAGIALNLFGIGGALFAVYFAPQRAHG